MNLTVDNAALQLPSQSQQHLTPRKSIIGKLERSSFQAQRLSDVGIAFSQQITAKVGLKLPASQERIVEQTRWLYLRYVFVKLRQNKLPLKDLNLTKSSRARRAAALGACSEAQIIVSISEPPSADALTLSDQRPLFTPKSGPGSPRVPESPRKRSALTTSIDARDLSLLAARIAGTGTGTGGGKRHMLRHQPACIDEDSPQASADEAENCAPESQLLASSSSQQQQHYREAPFAFLQQNSHLQQEQPLELGKNYSTISTDSTQSNSGRNKYVMDPTINNQIFTVITSMIMELRESRPEFYGDTIYEVIGLDKFSSLDSLLEVQKTICQEMTRAEISWERITALFSLFGAMSLDCVRLGAPEHVGPILDGFIGFVERDLALWISQQGGWESFLYKFRAGYRYGSIYKLCALAVSLLLSWALLIAYN